MADGGYGMLPRSTHTRMEREAARGRQSGRTQEIQRLIGRSIRAAFDLNAFGERTLRLDCDVIQADGGTRTASISGVMIAAYDAFSLMVEEGLIEKVPLRHFVAAISVGVIQGVPMLDLDYQEDSSCDTDMNVVMTEAGDFVEIQGTAEGGAFSHSLLNEMLGMAQQGIGELFTCKKEFSVSTIERAVFGNGKENRSGFRKPRQAERVQANAGTGRLYRCSAIGISHR